MYSDDDDAMPFPIDSKEPAPGAARPAIARFEAWLRSRGFDPSCDPFMPAASEMSIDAADLIGDYLIDRPGERANLGALAQHAREIGNVAPVWCDGGGVAVSLVHESRI